MASSSTIPATLDALVTLTRHVLAGGDAQVLDGGPTTQLDQNFVAIGYTGNPGEPAVTETRARAGVTTGRDREVYDVACLASSWLGEKDDAKAVRDRAFELVDAVAADLARDQTLAGTVTSAWLSTNAVVQDQTTKGAVATVRFTVHVDAFTR